MRRHAFPRRLPLTITWLSLTLWPLSTTEGRRPAAPDPTSARRESTVDASIPPGDDFFAYANGGWLKAAVIPSGRERWTVRDEINERTRQQVAAILDDAPKAPPGSVARMVADFRAALLDEATIEAKGLDPLAPMFARIDRVGDKRELARELGGTMRADVAPLDAGTYSSASVLGLSVAHSIHGETTCTAFLVQGGLALGTAPST